MNAALLAEFQCIVCGLLPVPPWQGCPNGHVLCAHCEAKVRERRSERDQRPIAVKCPTCNTHLPRKLVGFGPLDRLLKAADVAVPCGACPAVLGIAGLGDHRTRACPSSRVSCGLVNCSMLIAAHEFINHRAVCLERRMRCPLTPYCDDRVDWRARDVLASHLVPHHAVLRIPAPALDTWVTVVEGLTEGELLGAPVAPVRDKVVLYALDAPEPWNFQVLFLIMRVAEILNEPPKIEVRMNGIYTHQQPAFQMSLRVQQYNRRLNRVEREVNIDHHDVLSMVGIIDRSLADLSMWVWCRSDDVALRLYAALHA